MSDEGYRIFGFPARKEPLDYETLLERIQPKDRRYHKEMTESLISDGKAEFEYRILTPEGIERWVGNQGEVYYDRAGIPLRTFGTIQDITERKRAEEALVKARDDLKRRVTERIADLTKANQQLEGDIEEHKRADEKLGQAERRYRTVADFTCDWEYWANLDGTLEYVSPSCERISGYRVQDFMENPSLFQEIIVPEDCGIWDHFVIDSKRDLTLKEIQFRIKNKDGEFRWI